MKPTGRVLLCLALGLPAAGVILFRRGPALPFAPPGALAGRRAPAGPGPAPVPAPRPSVRSDGPDPDEFERWLEADPAAASRWIVRQPGITGQHARLVANKLAMNPPALDAYADQLPEGAWKRDFLVDAARAVADRDPAEALALARRLGPGKDQMYVWEDVAWAWSRANPDAALAWIMTIDDPAQREPLIAAQASAIEGTDPKRAATLLLAGVHSPEVLVRSGRNLVDSWMSPGNPRDAAAWVAQLPAGPLREATVNLVLQRWLASDPAAAQDWILTLPERDGILQAIRQATAEEAAKPYTPPPRRTGPTYSTGGLDRPIDDP